MKDLDFDELDRAVNTAMADSSSVNNDNTQPVQANQVPQSSVVNPTPATSGVPLANRRGVGKIMDIVRPASSTPTAPASPAQAPATPAFAQPVQPSPIVQPAPTAVESTEPSKPAMQESTSESVAVPVTIKVPAPAPVVNPAPTLVSEPAPQIPPVVSSAPTQVDSHTSADLVGEMPEKVSRHGMTLNPVSTTPVVPDEIVKPKSVSASQAQPPITDWPDPIDFHNANFGNDQNQEAKTTDGLAPTEAARPSPETSTEPQVEETHDDIDKIGDDIAMSLGQKNDDVLDSPFIPNTKVEKRPLGAFSVNDESPKNDINTIPGDMNGHFNSEAPLPAELQDELLMIESSEDVAQPGDLAINQSIPDEDTNQPVSEDAKTDQAPQERSNTETPPVQQIPVINTPPVQPIENVPTIKPIPVVPVLSKTNSAEEEPKKEEKIDPAMINPELNTINIPSNSMMGADGSIAMSAPTISQHKEHLNQRDNENVAIYDTKSYHKPMIHPGKKNNWMVILWISLLIVAGVGVGVAVYFVAIPH